MKRWTIGLAATLALISGGLLHAEEKLNAGDRVAIIGDSITEQKNYSVLIEDYLLACQPAARLQAAQFGWGGETTWGFAPRMKQDVLWFKPDAATINYGMNDGGYAGVDQKRLDDYKKNTRDIIEQLKAAGTKLIVVGGPGAVDADSFRTFIAKGPEAAKMYNQTLKTFGDAAEQVAKEEGVVYANLHNIMADAMVKFKQQHPDKSFVGGDGIHPENVGHTVMAYAFLKGLGCDGNIGSISVDFADHKADASDGHKVVSIDGDTLTLQSTRYPFAIKKSDNPTDIYAALSLVPFQDELNRFTLKVTGIPAGKKVKITWAEVPGESAAKDGKNSPIEVSNNFDAEQLEHGINLSSSFDTTPFEHAFANLDAAVHAQQDFETPLNKTWLHREPEWKEKFPQAADEVTTVGTKAKAMDEAMRELSGKMVVPVKHTLRFEVQ